jgi:hypothetical protein
MGLFIELPLGAPFGRTNLGKIDPQGLSVLAHFFALAPIDFVLGVPVRLPLGVSPYAIVVSPFRCPKSVVEYGLARRITCSSYTPH